MDQLQGHTKSENCEVKHEDEVPIEFLPSVKVEMIEYPDVVGGDGEVEVYAEEITTEPVAENASMETKNELDDFEGEIEALSESDEEGTAASVKEENDDDEGSGSDNEPVDDKNDKDYKPSCKIVDDAAEMDEFIATVPNSLPDFEIRLGRVLANPKLTGPQRRVAFFENTCFKCGLQCESEAKLRIHQKQAHDFKRLYYFCCGRKFSDEFAPGHIAFHIDPSRWQCPGCEKQALARSQFHRHIRACKSRPECPHCGEAFRPVHYRQHVASHEEKPPPAKKERKTKVREDGVILYNRRKGPRTRPNNYTCDLCKHTFDTWHQIQKHMNNIHLRLNEEASNYVCEHCGFSTLAKESLKNHIAIMHSGLTKQPCPYCNRMVKLMDVHIRLHHDNSSPTVCKDCGQSFPNHRLRDMHWRRKHDDRKKNVCNICGKSYKHKYQLSEHAFSHTGTYKYSCEFCCFQVNYSRNLRVHRRTAHPKEYQKILENRLKDLYGEKMAPKSIEGNKGQLATLAIAKKLDIIESEVVVATPSHSSEPDFLM